LRRALRMRGDPEAQRRDEAIAEATRSASNRRCRSGDTYCLLPTFIGSATVSSDQSSGQIGCR
jgi:hypothetical protein